MQTHLCCHFRASSSAWLMDPAAAGTPLPTYIALGYTTQQGSQTYRGHLIHTPVTSLPTTWRTHTNYKHHTSPTRPFTSLGGFFLFLTLKPNIFQMGSS